MKEKLIDRLAGSLEKTRYPIELQTEEDITERARSLHEYRKWSKTRGWHLRPEGGWDAWEGKYLPKNDMSLWTIQLKDTALKIALWHKGYKGGTWHSGDEVWGAEEVVAYKEPPEPWEGK